MIIKKVVELQAIMDDPCLQSIYRLQEQFNQTKEQASRLLEMAKDIYDPLQDKWNQWCMDNMTQEERDYIIHLYKTINELVQNAK